MLEKCDYIFFLKKVVGSTSAVPCLITPQEKITLDFEKMNAFVAEKDSEITTLKAHLS